MSITAEDHISLDYAVSVIACYAPICYSSYSMAIHLFKDKTGDLQVILKNK